MGAELGQWREWAHDRSLDWHLLEQPDHASLQAMVGELNRVQGDEPALWEADFEASGFQWIDANDADQSCYSFLRTSRDGSRVVAVLANLTPIPRYGYRVGLPRGGRWRTLLNTDETRWGGSGVSTELEIEPEAIPWHGRECSAVLTLPPLGVLWLAPA